MVNPGMGIPPSIQGFTGITDAMVAGAPPFAELADGVRALLADCVFVAHNARFDYGFIKNEFRRIGQDFDAPVLCTVKLSRALYPQFHRHGLDALIERHGLTCTARHRAMGDTEALHQFAGIVAGQFERDVLDAAIVKAMKAPSRPAGLPEGVLEGLPEGPGVYFFYGENDLPIYIGKSVSLRSRVMSHFSADHRSGKEAKLAQQVRRVEWQQTAGELGALLLEARLVKERKPTENRLLRETDAVFGLRFDPARKRGPVLVRELLGGGDPAGWADVYGSFRTKKEADNALRGAPDMLADPAVQQRIDTLAREANVTLDAIRTLGNGRLTDPLTDADVLAGAVQRGILDAPHLRNNTFARGEIRTAILNGACVTVDSSGREIKEEDRFKTLHMKRESGT